MGLLSYLGTEVGRLVRLMFAPILPLEIYRSPDELNEAIRIYKMQLSDPHFSNKPKYRATAVLQLAIAYYQKAFLSPEFDLNDINLAIQFAHQAESFFSKEVSLSGWRRLQEILGFAYFAKGEGSRPEHYALAMTYFQNLLELAEVEQDVESQIKFRKTLLILRAGGLWGSPSEKLDQIKEDLAQISMLEGGASNPQTPGSADLETVARWFASMPGGIGNIDETTIDALPSIFKGANGNDPNSVADIDAMYPPIWGLQILSQATMKLDSFSEKALDRLSEQDKDDLYEAFEKQDYSRLKEVMSVAELESVLTWFDERIEEISKLLTSGKLSADDIEMMDFLVAMLYLLRAPFESQPMVQSKGLALSRYHFEHRWQSFQKSARPFNVFMVAKTYGTVSYFRFGMWLEANKLFAAAVDIMERNYKSSMGMLGKQSTLLGVNENKLSLLLNQVYVLARLERTKEAVVLLEKWRGRQLNERLRRSDLQLAQVQPQDLAEYQHTLTTIFDLESKQRKLEGHAYVESVRELREAEALLEKIIGRIRGYVRGFLTEPTFDDLVAAATRNCPLAYLLTTEVGGLIMLLTHQGEVRSLWLDRLTSQDLEAIMDKLLAPLKLSDSAGPSGASMETVLPEIMRELGDRVVRDLCRELTEMKATAVCLIPCGSLALLPVHAAILNEATTGGDAVVDGDDIQRSFEISYAPSATILSRSRHKVALLEPESTAASFRLVGVGDPNQDLNYAVLELNAISRLFNPPHSTLLLLGLFAVKEILKTGLSAATHIHFACHGEFKDPSKPLDAALLLAGGQTLTLREVFDEGQFQDLTRARMVTLSACKSALVDFRELPEEVMGLPAGFLAAGVPGVIGTLWSVDDLSTALLMTRFYGHLIKEKLSPALSLATAQRWLRDATWEEIDSFCDIWPELSEISQRREAEMARPSPHSAWADKQPFSNPYYWAGFIFVGA